jgi:ribosomal protein L29
MSKKENIIEKTDQELKQLVSDARGALRTERFSAAGARAKDSNGPKKLRKQIARILTEQHTRVQKSAN